MSGTRLFAFVILHFGSVAVTDRCVRSIRAMDEQERIRIVIVDNEVDADEARREKVRARYEKPERVSVLTVRAGASAARLKPSRRAYLAQVGGLADAFAATGGSADATAAGGSAGAFAAGGGSERKNSSPAAAAAGGGSADGAMAGGFSYANNLGYRFARDELGAGFIVVANNDIEFLQKDFLRRLEDVYAAQPCHVIGPDVVRAGTGEHQNPMAEDIPTAAQAQYTIVTNRLAMRLWPFSEPVVRRVLEKQAKGKVSADAREKAADGRQPAVNENCADGRQPAVNENCAADGQRAARATGAQADGTEKDPVLFGACLIFTPAFTGKEAAAFRPETRFFYEEFILALRCRRCGYRMVFAPELEVLHENGAATKQVHRDSAKRLRFMLERTAEACGIYRRYLLDGE